MKTFIDSLSMDIIIAIIISAVGGSANYLYKVSKGEQFGFIKMGINIFLAGFLGYIVQGFIEQGSPMSGPLLAISGFCAYPILNLLERQGTNLIGKFIK